MSEQLQETCIEKVLQIEDIFKIFEKEFVDKVFLSLKKGKTVNYGEIDDFYESYKKKTGDEINILKNDKIKIYILLIIM